MAVRMMTTKERAGLPNVETVRDYPGHEEGRLHHGPSCPHHGVIADGIRLEGLFPDCVTEGSYSERCTGPCDALYMETTHVGLVLETREWNGRDDSDFYALCWNPDKGEVERVEYASTRGWTYPNGASVDATPEVRAAADAYYAKLAAARAAAAAAAEAATPRKGKTLRVVKGRNVPRGTVGECIWYGDGKVYGYSYGAPPPKRVGLKTSDGTVHWTAATNVEVVLDAAAKAA